MEDCTLNKEKSDPIQAQSGISDSLTVSASQLLEASRTLAACLRKHQPEGGFKAIVAITRGGLSVAMYVATELDIRIIETIGIKNYDDDDNRLDKPVIIKQVMQELLGEGSHDVLLIDELVDSGQSMNLAHEQMPHAKRAVLHIKPDGRMSVDFYVEEVPQSTWIFYPRDTILGKT